jgi:sugar O-acyltransferase (sialic acid O-acetyltransferase NeuD family)
MAKRGIVIVGAGGFGREVRWLCEEINELEDSFEFLGYIVTDLSRLSEHDSKDLVLGDYSWLEKNKGKVDALAIGIGNGQARLTVSAALEPMFAADRWPALVHPNVRIDRASCRIAHGVLLCAGTVATVNVKFEPFATVNLACTVGHEAIVGRGCVLNPTVNISGGVELGAGVLVGTGAQILQNVKVGDGATVGAGAVVNKDVAPGATVVGIPAKPLEKKA